MDNIYANAVVGQSGGPTSAINATLFGVIEACLANRGKIKELYGMKNGIEGFLKEDFVELFSFFEDKEKLELLKSTPSSALGSCRMRLPQPEDDSEIYDKIISILKKHNIRYFFYIGGNDSMDTVAKLSRYAKSIGFEISVIGIPKTIDNDLVLTDHSPGYGSSAKYVATALEEILRDCAVYKIDAVTLVEIMGRDSGWLSAAAGLCGVNGKKIDFIYTPETVFSKEAFLSDVKKALQRHPDVVIALSEGIRYSDGSYVGADDRLDAFGHKYLSGASRAMQAFLKKEIGCKVRAIELNLTQRCAAHIASKTDIDESVEIGKRSVEIALKGENGKMTAFVRKDNPYRVEITAVDVELVAGKIKDLPPHFINEEGNGVTQACLDYVGPLVLGEHCTQFKNGLPVHLIID